MNKNLKLFLKTDAGISVILADFYLMGFIFHLIPFTLNFMPILTPFVLLLSGIMILFSVKKDLNLSSFICLAVIYILTYFFEAIGVATGRIFGDYSYGGSLGIKLLNVPLVIGFNWLIIIFGLYTGLKKLKIPQTTVPFLTAFLAVVFDFIMEPPAVALDYWSWAGGIIPIQNYIAWFLIALLCAWLLRIFRIETGSRLPVIFVSIEFMFFILLRIFLPGA